jgi:hypothetical protein
MPKDTVWLDFNGNFIVVEAKFNAQGELENYDKSIEDFFKNNRITYSFNLNNTTKADSILKAYTKNNTYQTIFEEQKSYYDKLGDELGLVLFCITILLAFYMHYKLKKYKQNPFAEKIAWVEIGTRQFNSNDEADWEENTKKRNMPKYLTYFGSELKFSKEQVIAVLEKRFPYFNTLSANEQARFYNRHKLFMKNKIFRIYDKLGLKEMPILLSATAIQFSFGLDTYLLPRYKKNF